MISRRLFLGRVVPAAAVAPLLKPGDELDLGDPPLELSGDDVLVVRFPEEATLDEIANAKTFLEAEVWPHVLLVQVGVELDVLRRSL